MASQGMNALFTLLLALVALHRGWACKSGRSVPRRQWGSNPIEEVTEEPVAKEEPEPSLPQDLQSLSELLSAVAGDSSDFFDPKWDQEWPNSSLSEEVIHGPLGERDR